MYPLSIRRVAVATLLALTMLLAWGLSNTDHQESAAGASISCSHGSQGIHEIYAPPSWPGDRAAHVVTRWSTSVQHTVYTKSGWWDPSWDYYYSTGYSC
jgi:hypothetical protein